MINNLFEETKNIVNLYEKHKEMGSYEFCRDVEIAYYSLNRKQRFFIFNKFFLKASNEWCRYFYSEQEYIKIRKNACGNFVRKFYEIH